MPHFADSTRVRNFSLWIQHSACALFPHLSNSINNIFLVHGITNVLTIAIDEDIKKIKADDK